MTPADRDRLHDIASDRPLAPLPTPEDIRILLAELERLHDVIEAAVQTAADVLLERLVERGA